MTSGNGASGSAWTDAWSRALPDGLPDALKAWFEAAGLGSMATPGAGDALGGVAAGYAAFARSIADLARGSRDGDFAQRLAALVRGDGTAAGADTAALRAFLASLPPEFAGAGAFTSLQRENIDTLLRWASEWLELPVFGPHREWIESLRQVQHAALAERRAANLMSAHRDAVVTHARERFAVFLEDESGPPVTSVRALYDIWIETAEAAWSEAVMGAPFSADFAAWVDAGSTVRLRVRALVTRISALVGVPQREDLETVLARQRSLADEVAALRSEVANLRAATDAQPAPGVEKAKRPAASPRAQTAKTRKTSSKRASPGARTAGARKRSASPKRREFDIGDILAGRD